MLCSVTVLGARNGADADTAAAKVVDYLKGQRADHGAPMRQAPGAPSSEPEGDAETPSRYYGDSAEQPGRWLGSGFGSIVQEGTVDGDTFSQLLLGINPETGKPLIGAAGSAGRAQRTRTASGTLPDGVSADSRLGLKAASEFLGLDRSYIRKLLARTAATRAAGDEPASVFLDGARAGPRRGWEVSVAELKRFAGAREAQSVVLGYDVTFSCPKSVSLLWAMVDPDVRTEILEAVEASVAAGIAYLEENGCAVRAGGAAAGDGLLAAGFLHATSRALDPQLHWHCVVINASAGPSGDFGALDARGLFAHAKTAGYLAGAHLRHEMARRLGVAWERSVHGLADIEGIDRDTIEAFSKRSTAIGEVADAAGLRTAAGRQSAALSTRSAKQAVDAAELIDGWHSELLDRGYTTDRIEALRARVDWEPEVSSRDRLELARELLSARGLTELNAVFDRRDVVQRISEWAGDRLNASDISDLADEFLTHPEVVMLGTSQPGRPGSVIQRTDGRTVRAATGAAYTTASMLSIESEIRHRFEDGIETGAALVPDDVLESALSSQPALGDDQLAMVRSICQSGDQVQCVLGPAGTGKTFALEVASRAWEGDGRRVIGIAVAGVAAEVLSRSMGIETTTVAAMLTRLETSGPAGLLDDRTVVIVDEASTLGTRDLSRLLRWTTETGAAVRLVGDPAQHSAVAAGGMFRHLVEEHPERVPVLTKNRRQAADSLGQVRLALTEYRDGQIAAALTRLERDDRVVSAPSADELLDALVADWYVDRQQRLSDPSLARSAMVAEHHFERTELNRRARAMLIADGSIHGNVLSIGGQEFQAGDEVICRAQDKTIRPAGGTRQSYVRNGTRGTVVEVRADDDRAGLVVDFDGRGEVFVPRAFLEIEVRPTVVGGLSHAYALTSHAAQGETYEAGRHLATDQSSREGVYVGLTRGRSDVRLYTVNRTDLAPRIDDDPGLPRLQAETQEARDAVANRLVGLSGERLATEQDGLGTRARHLRETLSPRELHTRAHAVDLEPDAVQAWEVARTAIAAEARLRPSPEAVERIGARPGPGAARRRWDTAAAAIAEHRAVHGHTETPESTADWSRVQATIDAATPISTSRSRGPEAPTELTEDFPSAGQSVATLPVISLER